MTRMKEDHNEELLAMVLRMHKAAYEMGEPWPKEEEVIRLIAKAEARNAELLAHNAELLELLTRSLKWIRRLEDRRDDIPHFFDAHTDPKPLRQAIEAAIAKEEG